MVACGVCWQATGLKERERKAYMAKNGRRNGYKKGEDRGEGRVGWLSGSVVLWENEGKEDVLRYRARATALGRYLIQEGRIDGAFTGRLEEITVRVAEAASSLLSRHGSSVGRGLRGEWEVPCSRRM